MINSRTTILLLFLSTLLLAGCGSPATESPIPEVTPVEELVPTEAEPVIEPTFTTEPQPYTLIDALGREVRFNAPPERIVIAGRGVFMIGDAIYLFPQAWDRIVALGETAQGAGNFIALIDPNYDQKTILGREAGAEQIAPAQPDAVVLKSYLVEGLGASVEALGVPVVYVDFETPEQYQRDLLILGQMLQLEDRATELNNLYMERLDQIQGVVGALEPAEKPRTLLLYARDTEGTVAFNVPPLNWIQTELVELAGGIPVWADASMGDGWTTVSLEQIAAWDPDKIVVVSYFSDPSEMVENIQADPNWELLRAVQQDEIYAFAFDLYSWDQPNPRWILGLQWLATKLHPDLFTDFDMMDAARTFYRDFYGLDAEFFEQNIVPTFKGDLP